MLRYLTHRPQGLFFKLRRRLLQQLTDGQMLGTAIFAGTAFDTVRSFASAGKLDIAEIIATVPVLEDLFSIQTGKDSRTEQILAHLHKADTYKSLIFEFDEHKTPESVFAYMCDKLDADIMSLYYDKDENCTLAKATTRLQETPLTVRLSDNGKNSMGECFRLFEYELNRLDPNFLEILNSAKNFLQTIKKQ